MIYMTRLGRRSFLNGIPTLATPASVAPLAPTSLTRIPDTLAPTFIPESTTPRSDVPDTHHLIQRKKNGVRGGQNLSERWRRLERSLRGKEAFGAHRGALMEQRDSAVSQARGIVDKKKHGPRMFRGLVLPEEPKEPQSDECCMSGCAICVYDLYTAAREDYTHAVDALRVALDAKGVSEEEWPADIQRTKKKSMKPQSSRDVSMNTFEALERALREKRESTGMGQEGSGGRSPVRPLQSKQPVLLASAADILEGLRWLVFSNR
ncbi:uncharacterized protein FIBRA_03235 [Fibroporia radiculosa]|uniref:Oxidoreductase-like domain-containing protein n=1 Tax=Fibroporia radiculosa TaxID=599839 RepID=J4HVV8_9APHY|nr:uncharacterized protein FIBRA_03235 [Fibroporia radiculosa]CCM01187.1 predicted protein [Fibroporia radiculosa]